MGWDKNKDIKCILRSRFYLHVLGHIMQDKKRTNMYYKRVRVENIEQ